MSNFVKPRTGYVSNKIYIEKLIGVNLRKDLHNNEEICPWCHGTGLVIKDNIYGLSDDPDKRAGMFPYKHQSLTFCQHCYNGIIHRCELCGEIMPKCRLKHDCEQQKALDHQAAAEKERKAMVDAKEYPSEALDDFVMCYYERYPYDNGYFMDWDSFFDWWNSDCEDEFERPVYVWGTTKTEITMDADSIIENATDDLCEDAEADISEADRKKLQALLDDWCANCGVRTTYYYTTECKVKIPWELYKDA